MGTKIYYRSLRMVGDEERASIESTARSAQAGKVWLGCEPVNFHLSEGGYLRGGSKPNLAPHPEDIASASDSGLPTGTVLDLIHVLSQISRDHRVDWEVVFEDDPPIGFIRDGHCDTNVIRCAEELAEFARMVAGMSQ